MLVVNVLGAGEFHIKLLLPLPVVYSSARNFMIYQRGTEQSYQKWAGAVGDDSYKWDALQPYFKRSVTFTPPSASRFANASAECNTSAFSTPGGPLQVSYANYAQPLSTWMEAALHEIGVPTIQDFNSGKLFGAQYCSSTIRPKSQTRDSSQTSFLNEALNRPNLKVYITTLAKKILFDSTKRAIGVIVESHPVDLLKYTLHARKEVILSAGAFQSPQLLMVSGIGPQAELQKHNIPVIADRPGVGQTMEDHVFFGPTWRVNVQTVTRVANDLLWTAKQYAIDYTIFKRGPLTNPTSDFLGWEKLPRNLLTAETDQILNNTFPADWPEMEYLVAPGYVGNLSNPFTTQPKDGYQYATIMGALIAPLSRGTVTLRSPDTKDLPLINPNWLTHPADVDVAIAIYKRLRAAFATNAMSKILLGGRNTSLDQGCKRMRRF